MTRIPDLVIERVHLGEASDAERQRVLADADARARLEALPSADAAFLEAHPASSVLPTIERKLHVRRTEDAVRDRQRRFAIGGALLVPLAAAILTFVAVQAPPTPVDGGTDPGLERTTAKWGEGARLFLYRDGPRGADRLQAEDAASAGDRLLIRYSALDATHGVIVSVDGRGAVTLHHPAQPTGDTRLQDGGETDLGFAYELDDAPRFERFYLVSDDVPVDVQAVLAAAREAAESGRDQPELALPDRLEQNTLILRKER
jgi:hypothetical protein